MTESSKKPFSERPGDSGVAFRDVQNDKLRAQDKTSSDERWTETEDSDRKQKFLAKEEGQTENQRMASGDEDLVKEGEENIRDKETRNIYGES